MSLVRTLAGAFAAIVLSMAAPGAAAQGVSLNVPTRPGVDTTLFWHPQSGAQATVLLFPGGAGGFGRLVDGRPSSRNFLVRSEQHFRTNGFNVAIFGRPSDMPDLDYVLRTGEEHMADIRAVIARVNALSPAPLWIVGTSRGSISATAAAIRLRDAGIAGIVLSSSVVGYGKPGAVQRQDLAAIDVPVLVLHHAKDACRVCPPHEVPSILRGLVNAPVKKLVMVDGGADPTGDACEALHWHGFIGMEEEAVGIIAEWIRNPVP